MQNRCWQRALRKTYIFISGLAFFVYAEAALADFSVHSTDPYSDQAAAVTPKKTGPQQPSAAEYATVAAEAESADTYYDNIDLDDSDLAYGPPVALAIDPCRQFDDNHDSWLDRSQAGVYRTVCGTTAWFDGFFGNRRYDQATGETFGRIGVGAYWDDYNGFDPSLRFRGRFALPSIRKRGTALLIGRGDDEDIIQERNTSGGESLPVAANTTEDPSTFIGVGYDRLKSLKRGLSYSVGAKVRAPPIPYAKVRYRRTWQLTERDLLNVRPLLYWQHKEGFGSTLNVDVDHAINRNWLFRWANFGNVSQDEEKEALTWGSAFYLFQALSNKRAITYSTFVTGETGAEVSLRNYGFELRLRRKFLRDWLFIEYIGGLSWPREDLQEKRDPNPGFGIRLEAYFGPAPESWVR